MVAINYLTSIEFGFGALATVPDAQSEVLDSEAVGAPKRRCRELIRAESTRAFDQQNDATARARHDPYRR